MATTDTRSGFRLPWSSDRPHDDVQSEPAADSVDAATTETADWTDARPAADTAAGAEMTAATEPAQDGDADAHLAEADPTQVPADPIASPADTPEEPQAMVQTVSARTAAAEKTPRKPSKLLEDLATAMLATAESAREQALAQVGANVQQVVESIRTHSTEGAAELRQRSDEDVAGIRDWSKTEIARIREEAEHRISGRKSTLEEEITSYSAAVDRRIADVQRVASDYEADMADFFDRLLKENDPARLATMAETMPEPPLLEPWADLDTLEVDAVTQAEPEVVAEPEAAVETETDGEPEAATIVEPDSAAEPAPDAVAETQDAIEPDAATDTEPVAETVSTGSPWGTADETWGTAPAVTNTDIETDGNAGTTDAASAVTPWAAELPEGIATVDDAGEPVDREAIMAALEAAAEAIVASEAEPDAADASNEDDDQFGAEAAAALAARMDATSFERDASFAERVSHLLPGRGETGPDADASTTQLMVTGLVSVASIASFKRNLSRMAGVQSVTVASGPDGEFVFNVTHHADLSFNDTIPTMPGFAARVTGSSDGIVNVTARDPETEG